MMTVEEMAALLLDDGSVIAPNATSLASLLGTVAGSYYLVVGNCDHLAVMSDSRLDCSSTSCSHDFCTTPSAAYGSTPKADASPVPVTA